MAYIVFTKYCVRYAIVETGLGGRLDVTNYINSLICGVGSISLDHCSILGCKIEEITFEKIGVIKKKIPIIVSFQNNIVRNIFRKYLYYNKTPFYLINNFYAKINKMFLGLKGEYQRENALLALTIIEKIGLKISKGVIKIGLKSVYWPGRYEVINRKFPILLDGAHNKNGIKLLLMNINNNIKYANQPVIIVFGLTKGHNIKNNIVMWKNYVKEICFIIITKSKHKYALSPLVIEQFFRDYKYNVIVKINLFNAIEWALLKTKKLKSLLVILGSLYLVGEVKNILLQD